MRANGQRALGGACPRAESMPKVDAQVPLRVEYEITEKGFELVRLLGAFAKWDEKWRTQ